MSGQMKSGQMKRCIPARSTTLNYEIMNALQSRIPKSAITKEAWFKQFKALKLCSYCNVPISSKGKGDHLYNVVGNTLSNMSDVRIPCCATCNSTKASKNWRQYIDKYHPNIMPENMAFIIKVDEYINNHKEEYEYDEEIVLQSKLLVKKQLEELHQLLAKMVLFKKTT